VVGSGFVTGGFAFRAKDFVEGCKDGFFEEGDGQDEEPAQEDGDDDVLGDGHFAVRFSVRL
jgi:hypothetical protein